MRSQSPDRLRGLSVACCSRRATRCPRWISWRRRWPCSTGARAPSPTPRPRSSSRRARSGRRPLSFHATCDPVEAYSGAAYVVVATPDELRPRAELLRHLQRRGCYRSGPGRSTRTPDRNQVYRSPWGTPPSCASVSATGASSSVPSSCAKVARSTTTFTPRASWRAATRATRKRAGCDALRGAARRRRRSGRAGSREPRRRRAASPSSSAGPPRPRR